MNKKQQTKKRTGLDFSFIFFSDSGESVEGMPYQLILDLARFGDQHDFKAVWVPERHHLPFGGIFPNPAVLGATLAQCTKHIRIRSGSVVLPLHHPVEVAESWSMVDNLSQGRVDLGFASGWNPNDFVVSPDTYGDLRNVWLERIPMVQKLWRGESLIFKNGKQEDTPTKIYPSPVQKDINIWMTATKKEETFAIAGAHGYNVLTMLQGTDLEELNKKIAVYRKARKDNGFNPDEGVVTLMMHTLVHHNKDLVMEKIKQPFYNYVKSSFSGHIQALDPSQRPSEAQIENTVAFSYERYVRTAALFGTPDSTQEMLHHIRGAGVDEVACLMDFGVDYDTVIQSLGYLNQMKNIYLTNSVSTSTSKNEVAHFKHTDKKGGGVDFDHTNIELLNKIEPYCGLAVLQVFQNYGLFNQAGMTVDQRWIDERVSAQPEYKPMLVKLLKHLVKSEYLNHAEGVYTALPKCNSSSLADMSEKLNQQALNESTEFLLLLRILARSCSCLMDIISGKASISWSNEELRTVNFYLTQFEQNINKRDSAVFSRTVSLSVQKKLQTLSREKEKQGPVRIIDLGQIDDITRMAVIKALSELEQINLSYSILHQGPPDESIVESYEQFQFVRHEAKGDISLEANVDIVLAASAINQSQMGAMFLDQYAQKLAPGGLLVLKACTEIPIFSVVTKGLKASWWYSNLHFNNGQWRQALSKVGFAEIRCTVDDNIESESAGNNIVLAVMGKGESLQPVSELTMPPQNVPKTEDNLDSAYRQFHLYFAELLGSTLKISSDRLDMGVDMSELGMESVLAGEFITQLSECINAEISPTLFFANNSGNMLAKAIWQQYEEAVVNAFAMDTAKEAFVVKQPESDTVNPAQLENSRAILTKGDGRGEIDEQVKSLFEQEFNELLSEILRIPLSRMDFDIDLSEMGMDSVMAGELITRLGKRINVDIPPTLFFANSSANKLQKAIAEDFFPAILAIYSTELTQQPAWTEQSPGSQKNEKKVDEFIEKSNNELVKNHKKNTGKSLLASSSTPGSDYVPIAIVGISGRYPGADSVEDFWQNLETGVSSVTELPRQRWTDTDFANTVFPKKDTLKTACLDSATAFDPAFFNISPGEAASMDPRQRLLLETAWHTVEDAGYAAEQLTGSQTAVYIGIENNEYAELADIQQPWYGSSTALCMLANRISYYFDWHANSEAVDTSCTSSLVAIHRACKALQVGECDQALVAAVSIIYSPKFLLGGLANGMLSKDGTCRPFSEDGNGSVTGEGVGAVMLKPLTRAEEDGDHIYGVILGSAVGHGGKVSSISAPNEKQQAATAKQAYRLAGVKPDDISYLEAHGVGAAMVDVAEFMAMDSAFSASERKQYCALGTLTPNIGNLDPASGMAGIHKILMAFKHKALPPTLNSSNVNRFIHLQNSAFYINSEKIWWHPKGDQGQAISRKAAINTYAWSGVNAHMILEEYESKQQVQESISSVAPLLFLLSAKNIQALSCYAQQYADYLKYHSTISLENLAYSLQTGRNDMASRLCIIFDSHEDLISKLSSWLEDRTVQRSDIFHNGNTDAEPEKTLAKPSSEQVNLWLQQNDFSALAKTWVSGAKVSWRSLYQKPPVRMPIPGYPFEHNKVFNIIPKLAEPKKIPQVQTDSINIEKQGSSRDNNVAISKDNIAEQIKEILIDFLSLDEGDYQVDKKFTQLGMDSLVAMQFCQRVSSKLDINLLPLALFNHQTPEDLATYLHQDQSALCQQRNDIQGASLIEQLAEAGISNLEGISDIVHQPFALTDLQRAYYLGEGDSFSLGNMVAHQYFEFEMPEFDVAKWCDIWQKLSLRHPMLNCYINDDQKWNYFSPSKAYRPNLHDYTGYSDDESLRLLNEHREQLKTCSPSTDQWPLYEVNVYTMPNGKVIVHYNMALVMLDGLSTWTLFYELQVLYKNLEAQLPPLKLMISDYMAGLQTLSKTPAYKQAEEYWMERLAKLPDAPILPQCREISEITQYSLTDYCESISAKDWSLLKQKSAEEGITPSMMVYSVFASVLAHWAESSSFSVNILHFNRPDIHPQYMEVLGNLSTTLLLQTKVSGKQNFIEVAQNIQRQYLRDMQHSVFNGLQVQQARNRHLRRVTPAMPIVFTSLSGFASESASQNVSDNTENAIGKLIFDGVQTPQVTLDCAIFEYQGCLQIRWAVLDDIYPDGMIQAMLAAKTRLLRDLARDYGNWDRPVHIPLPQEQLARRLQSNATWKQQSQLTLHQLFQRNVSKFADKAAVISQTKNLSYTQLSRYSSAIANHLSRLGARSNALVAVVMNKGWQQVPAVLGILEAGAAYLPVNASYPQQRIEQLLELGNASIVLTQPDLNNKIKWPDHVRRIIVDETLLTQPHDTISRTIVNHEVDDLAYVIFTSGSTGTPKGVMMNHRAVVNTVLDINERFCIGEQDTVLSVSDLNFDLSVYDIFGLLAVGGTVVIPPEQHRLEPAQLWQWIERHNITVWNSVPAYMVMLQEYRQTLFKSDPTSLRLILLSGDWIPVELAKSMLQLRSLSPALDVVSLGGATECAIWSIYHLIESVDPQWQSIPYGKPLQNQQFYVLDSNLRDCADYVPGELYIGGVGLAQGYWQDVDKTDRAFIFHPQKQIRLYKTGDLGFYQEDGSICFLGRRDTQVKVQGYRIELGEIENCIKKCSEVKGCVVTLSENNSEKRLIAYLIPNNERWLRDNESQQDLWRVVEQQIAGELPAYMLPKQWILIADIPLSENGKVDRRQLPKAPSSQSQNKINNAIFSEVENQLANIWCDILDVSNIKKNDSFFDLGGHSISAVRLVTRINKNMQKNMQVNDLVENDTIASLATFLSRSTVPTSVAKLDLLGHLKEDSDQKEDGHLILIHAIGGNIMAYHSLLRKWNPALKVSAIRQSDFSVKLTVDELANYYLTLISEAGIKEPYILAGWSFGGIVAFEMARQLESMGRKARALIMIDSWAPIYPERSISDEQMVAGFALNLIASDGENIAQLPTFDKRYKHGDFSEIKQYIESKRRDELEFTNAQLSELYSYYVNNTLAMLNYRPELITTDSYLIKANDERSIYFREHPAWRYSCLGWSAFSDIQINEISGDHFSIFTDLDMPALIQQMDFIIEKIAPVTTSREDEMVEQS